MEGKKKKPSAPSGKCQRSGGAGRGRAHTKARLGPGSRKETFSRSTGGGVWGAHRGALGCSAGPGVPSSEALRQSQGSPPPGCETTHKPWLLSRACLLRPASKG